MQLFLWECDPLSDNCTILADKFWNKKTQGEWGRLDSYVYTGCNHPVVNVKQFLGHMHVHPWELEWSIDHEINGQSGDEKSKKHLNDLGA